MTAYYEQPLRLVWNKLIRYPGGREIDRFRGIEPGADDGRPEAWVGSCARVINAAQLEDKNEGMAKVNMPDGSVIYVQELIDMDPAAVLGAEHARKYGNNSSLLVKARACGPTDKPQVLLRPLLQGRCRQVVPSSSC